MDLLEKLVSEKDVEFPGEEFIPALQHEVEEAVKYDDTKLLARFLELMADNADGMSEFSPEFIPQIFRIDDMGKLPESVKKVKDGLMKNCKARDLHLGILRAFTDRDISEKTRLSILPYLERAVYRLGKKKSKFMVQSVPLFTKICHTEEAMAQSLDMAAQRIDAITNFCKRFIQEARAEGEKTPDVVMRLETLATALFTTVYKNLTLIRFDSLDVQLSDAKVEAEVTVSQSTEDILLALQRCVEVAALSVDVCAILDRLDCTNPTDDGGGDVELSPISIAAFAYVSLIHGAAPGRAQPIPPFVAAWRLADWSIKAASLVGAFAEEYPHFAQCSTILFSRAARYLEVAAEQNPSDFTTTVAAMRRWSPDFVFPHLLDFMCSDPRLAHAQRVHLFARMVSMIRCYDWPARADLYLSIASKSTTDQGIGRLISCFKEDWWSRVCECEKADRDEKDKHRVHKVLKSVLGGDLRLRDSMDVITAALNICKLGLRNEDVRAWFLDSGLDLPAKAKNIASQVDAELTLVNKDLKEYDDANPGSDGNQYLLSTQLRIQLVADGVKRVRELIADPKAE